MKKRASRPNYTVLSIALVAALSILAMCGQWLVPVPAARAEQTNATDPGIVSEEDGFCVISPLSLEQRVAGSELIVEGEVVSKYSFWDAGRKNIYTSNLVRVYKVFQGSFDGSEIEVITEGGRVDNDMDVVTPSLQLAEGDMGIFFAEQSKTVDPASRTGRQPLRAFGSVQGFIRYDVGADTARDPFKVYRGIESEVYESVERLTGTAHRTVAENRRLLSSREAGAPDAPDATPTISGFGPNPITAGTGAVLTITGNNFGATRGNGFVEFRTGDNGGQSYIQPLASDYVSWSNTQIQVRVPGTGDASTGTIRVTNSDPATTTTTSALTITYTLINLNDSGFGKHAVHQDRDFQGGYTFQVSNNQTGGMAGNTAAVASLGRAIDTWKCSTGINFKIGSNTTVNTSATDNINVVAFDNAQPLAQGVLAAMTSRFSGCGQGPGQFEWYVRELDFIASRTTAVNWQFGPALPSISQYDFETVALHEFGHGHQLAHNNNGTAASGSFLYWAIQNGVAKRTLSSTFDVPGGLATMAASTSVDRCGNTRMVAATCGTGGGANEVADFDGDGRTDVSVFRPSNGTWYLLRSTSGFTGIGFGQNGDRPVPGDYDGDGKTDVAVYRNGTWYRLNSSTGGFVAQSFGTAGDVAVPGRYDSDNRTDLAVFRPSNGTWYVLRSTDGGLTSQQFGQNGDTAVSGDYDADGRTDFTVFRPSNGTWYIQRSTAGFTSQQFGQNGDRAVPGDFDADGKTDIAVWRPATGTWYLQRSQLGFAAVNWGANGDQPSAGDYDGDNRSDVAVFRPSTGTFYILQSTTNTLRAEAFGTNGDLSVPGAYAP